MNETEKPKKQPYRITVDLKNEELYNFFIEMSKKFYNGKKGKCIRALLKKVRSLSENESD